MDNRIDKTIYQLEDIQEELKDLETIDRIYLLDRIGEVKEAVEQVLIVVEDIEIG